MRQPLLLLLLAAEAGCFQDTGLEMLQSLAQMRVSGTEALTEPYTDRPSVASSEASIVARDVSIGPLSGATSLWPGEVLTEAPSTRLREPRPPLEGDALARFEGGFSSLQEAAAGIRHQLLQNSELPPIASEDTALNEQAATVTLAEEQHLAELQEAVARSAQVRAAAVEERMARMTEVQDVAELEEAEALREKETAENHAKDLSRAEVEAQAQANAAVQRVYDAAVAMEQAWSQVQAADVRVAHATAAKVSMAMELQEALGAGPSRASNNTTVAPIGAVVGNATDFLCGGRTDCILEMKIVTFGYKTTVMQGTLDWFWIVALWILSIYCCSGRGYSSAAFCRCQGCVLAIAAVVIVMAFLC